MKRTRLSIVIAWLAYLSACLCLTSTVESVVETSSKTGTTLIGDTKILKAHVVNSSSIKDTENEPVTDALNSMEDESSEEHDDDKDFEEDYEESTEGMFPKTLYIFFIYFVLIFGILGNVLVFTIMHHGSPYVTSYSVYLRFLSIVDTAVLILIGVEDIIEHHFDLLDSTILSSQAICRVWNFFGDMTLTASPWLVVAFTFDRYIAVVFPFQWKRLSTRKIAFFVAMVIVGLAALESMSLNLAIQYGVEPEEDGDVCEEAGESLEAYMAFRRLCLQSNLPCALILYANLHIIVGIHQSSKFRRSATDLEREKVKADRRITVSLVAVSLMAFCCLCPVAIAEVAEIIWKRQLDKEFSVFTNTTNMEEYRRLGDHIERIDEVWPLLNLIKLVNFGQNFYVMMASCQKYRDALVSIVSMCCLRRAKKKVGSSTRNTSSTRISSKI